MPANTIPGSAGDLPDPRKIATDAAAFADDVRRLAKSNISEAKRRLRRAALRTALHRIAELYEKHKPPALGSFYYLLIAGVGMTYSVGYYYSFRDHIRILDLFSTPDFFLSAFGNLFALLLGVVSPLLALTVLIPIFFFTSREKANLTARARPTSIFLRLMIMIPIASILFPLAVAFPFGMGDSYGRVDHPQYVQFTTNSYPNEPDAGLANRSRTILLGTTSAFHIFYECSAPDADDAADDKKPPDPLVKIADWFSRIVSPFRSSLDEKDDAEECGRDGLPFIVPTANIASISFVEKPRVPDEKNGPNGNGATGNGGGDEYKKQMAAALTSLSNTLDRVAVNTDGAGSALTVNVPILAETNAALLKHNDQHSPADPETLEGIARDVKALVDRPSATLLLDSQSVATVKSSLGEVKDAVNNLNETIVQLDQRGAVGCTNRLAMLGIVGPFPEGRFVRGDPTNKIEDIARRLFKDQTPQYLMLVGRVDSKQPGSEQIEHLALARARWVRDGLKEKALELGFTYRENLFQRALLLGADDPRAGVEMVSESGDEVRVVEVWACGTPKR